MFGEYIINPLFILHRKSSTSSPAKVITALTLHNQKVRIVHIQLHRMKQIRHLPRRTIPPIDQIFALPPDQNLPRHIHLLALLIAHGTAGLVLVVKDDGDGGLVDTGLTLLVDQFGEVAGADLGEILDSENEADGIEDVGFSGAVEAGDGVEVRVEPDWLGWSKCLLLAGRWRCSSTAMERNLPGNHRAVSVGFEPVDDNLLDVHGAAILSMPTLLLSADFFV